MVKSRKGIQWEWVKYQVELGVPWSQIPPAHKKAFGIDLPIGTLKSTISKNGWKPIAGIAVVERPGMPIYPFTKRGKGRPKREEEPAPEETEDMGLDGDPPTPLVPISPSYVMPADRPVADSPEQARRNAIKQRMEEKHRAKADRLHNDATALLDVVQEKIATDKKLTTSMMRDLGQAMEKAANILFEAIQLERKSYQMDKVEEGRTQGGGVNRILIVTPDTLAREIAGA